jgi:sphinganine-1-phosphate aldolase
MGLPLPKRGVDRDKLLDAMAQAKSQDVDWRHGRGWSLVYYANEEHADFLKRAYNLYFTENGLSPAAFPSLRKFESEVVAMVLDLLGARGDEAGSMTSGGTESILLAVKTYRDWARVHRPDVVQPEMVLPASAHPAFFKAAQYFDVRPVRIPVDTGYRADLNALRRDLSEKTILIVASAPSYPQGVVDPITEIAEVATKNKIGLHVDACLGGFLLPFLRKLGHAVPAFDFSVPGVTSISADLHKNGYAAKGASVLAFRDAELRRFQYFVDPQWTGGIYGSPSMAGTRPGGAIAAAWAALMSLGEDGYLALARQTIDVARSLMRGIEAIAGLRIVGSPDMSVFAFTADNLNVFAIAERMSRRGWRLDRQRNPDCVHMIATPNHAQAIAPFLQDLREEVLAEREQPAPRPRQEDAMLYGVTSDVPAGARAEDVILAQLDAQYRL